MENSYESGFAFVLEGATERVFYERLLYFFARKHPNCSIEKNQDSETFETFFTVRGPFGIMAQLSRQKFDIFIMN